MVSWLLISKCYLHSPLESMVMKGFVIWFPWKPDMCCLEDLGNMIEMLPTLGSPIDIFFLCKGKKVVLSPLSLSEVCEDQIKMRLKREKKRKSKKAK